MDPEVIAALIVLFGTVLGLYVNTRHELRKQQESFDNRIKELQAEHGLAELLKTLEHTLDEKLEQMRQEFELKKAADNAQADFDSKRYDLLRESADEINKSLSPAFRGMGRYEISKASIRLRLSNVIPLLDRDLVYEIEISELDPVIDEKKHAELLQQVIGKQLLRLTEQFTE